MHHLLPVSLPRVKPHMLHLTKSVQNYITKLLSTDDGGGGDMVLCA